MALEDLYEPGETAEAAPVDQPAMNTEEMFRLGLSGENMAEHLSTDELRRIGSKCWEGYRQDKNSQDRWEKAMHKAVELALQVSEMKSTPWDNASNVKMPILTMGALQFASRAYPAIVREPQPVRCRVNGEPTQAKLNRAGRKSRHMSYQLLEQMDGWVEGMDALLHILPLWGCAYKKTYQGAHGPRSDLVRPENLVFDYYAKSIETCRRKTETFLMHRQEIVEKQREGVYREFPLTALTTANPPADELHDRVGNVDAPPSDENTPCEVLEQHTYWDLDGDGYEEPYIITFTAEGQEVCRISARYEEEGIRTYANGKFTIDPVEYYTGYTFFPDPTGGVRGLGWGSILFPINDAINSITNQLIDAGTLANQQGGIIDERLAKKWPGGALKVKMNEWIRVNGAMFQDIRNGLLPWPTKGPSPVLFQLLGLLIPWAQKLTSVTDSMAGENPPTNQPATTTMALLEQGQKVFAGVHKRVFRAFHEELKKLSRLNRIYLRPEVYFQEIGASPQDIAENAGMNGYQPVFQTDYADRDIEAAPSADPNIQTQAEKRARAEALMVGMKQGMVFNPQETARWFLDAWDIPASDQKKLIMPPQPPPPDPKVITEGMKQQTERAWIDMEGKTRTLKAQHDAMAERHKQAMAEGNLFVQKLGKELEAARLQWQAHKEGRELRVKEFEATKPERGGG